jgi:hypothetical protein
VPEQLAVPLGPGGVHEMGDVGGLIEPGGDTDRVVDELRGIHDAVTNPAMSDDMRVRYTLIALRYLAAAVKAANGTPAPPFWHWTTQRKIAIRGVRVCRPADPLGPGSPASGPSAQPRALS